jgi:rod shape determining protein RodA
MGAQGLIGEAVDRIGGEPISARMARKAPIKHVDLTLLLAALALAVYGVVMVSTATGAGIASAPLSRQALFVLIGSVALLSASFFDYRHLKGLSPIVYGASLFGLVLVLLLGDVTKGARRWINLGVFQAQPSELAKLALIITLAAFLAERKGDIIYLEPDLGTMMILVTASGALLLVGGAKIRHFVTLGVLGALAVLLVLQMGLLKDYQLQRLTAFRDPNPDVRSEAYNLYQAKIAIASGGMRGKGLQRANTQTSLDFVPEQHTDFIFTAVGEQLGFIGAATLLGLFGLLIWRALRIAGMSRDLFGTLIAAGIAAVWAFQLFVNVGMTMGIMPITGIPLPFISYGGSSLLTHFVAVGLLLNIHMRRFL